MRILRALRHRLAHWTGLNRGTVEAWFEGDRLFVGFRCVGCGRLAKVTERTPFPTPDAASICGGDESEDSPVGTESEYDLFND